MTPMLISSYDIGWIILTMSAPNEAWHFLNELSSKSRTGLTNASIINSNLDTRNLHW
jgi:hypothetical protein